MKCFYHGAIDAVAMCKNCSRGVCRDCGSELENGIACKDRCEAEVIAIDEIIRRNKTSHVKARAAYGRNALIFALLGILFSGYGVLSFSQSSSLKWLLILSGAIFIFGAVLYYTIGQKYAGH